MVSRDLQFRTADDAPALCDSSPLGRAGLLFALLGALVLLWPMLLHGGPLVFHDSPGYAQQGGTVLRFLLGFLPELGGSAEPVAEAAAGAPRDIGDLNARADSARSIPYSVFVAAVSATPIGVYLVPYVQGVLVLLLLWPLAAPLLAAAPGLFAAAAALAAVATPLPFFVSYVMPDVFGACVILYALVLVATFDRLDWPSRGLLALIAAFAVVTHYGNIPLAVVMSAAVPAAALLRRRLTAALVAAAVIPLLLAIAVNGAASLVASGGSSVSVAPLRLPILLARSIEDGPARWHLDEHCDDRRYAVCEVFAEGIPDDIASVMWRAGGLRDADRGMLDRIRAEEPTILWRAFLDYPLAQTVSFGSNAFRQFFLVGAGDFFLAAPPPGATDPRASLTRGEPMPGGETLRILYTATYFGGLALLMLGLVRGGAGERVLVLVLFAGFVANALVFGGLSAPVDRYQARIAWLAPVLALIVFARLRSPHARS